MRMAHPPVMPSTLEIVFKGCKDAMSLSNNECGINDCIAFGSLSSPYSFLDTMYQDISAKKHTVSELISLKRLLYRQNEMTAYFSAMNNITDLF